MLPKEVESTTGKAFGRNEKAIAATIDKIIVVRRLQKNVESHTKLFEPFFLPKEAVPAVIEKNIMGKTIKMLSFNVIEAIKFTNE